MALATGSARWRVGAVRAWFVGIVCNTARGHRRRQRRPVLALHADLPQLTPDDHGESGDRVLATGACLPESERLALWLNVVEGLKCRVIEEQCGRPAGTVRLQVARAFARLHRGLGAGPRSR